MNSHAPFDAIAQEYDREFTTSPTGRLQRARVHAFLRELDTLRRPAQVLELNCGTGEDALWLAGQGHHVTATDASERMLEVAREKIRGAGPLTGSVRVLRHDLREPANAGWASAFDLVFSDFGGLNCLDASSLRALATKLSGYLRPGGRFVSVVMGRRCITEQLYFLSKGSFSKAFRRKQTGPLQVHLLEGYVQPTWYYAPAELDELLAEQFMRTHCRPIGLFLPPSYLDRSVAAHPKLLRWLDRLERTASGFTGFADRADHYLAAYRVRPQTEMGA